MIRLATPLILFLALHCSVAQSLFEGNVRIVINSSSTGGDTYQNARMIARALAQELGVNIKVDAVGTIVAFQELERVSDGSTLMIAHDQAYLGYLYERSGYFDIFDKTQIGPTVAINPGNAYLASKAADYDSVDELMLACMRGERVRVAIQAGGVSELGYSALRNALAIRYPGAETQLVPIFTGPQSEKNQLLFDGQADVISGSIQANEQYTRLDARDQKAMKFLWLTSRKETMDQLDLPFLDSELAGRWIEPSMPIRAGSSVNFNFDKEFFFLYNKSMSSERVAFLDAALARIFERGELQEEQLRSSFIPGFRPSAEARAYLLEKSAVYDAIISSGETSVGGSGAARVAVEFEDSHLFFPRIVTALVASLFVCVVLRNWGRIRERFSRVVSIGLLRWLFADRKFLWIMAAMTALYFGLMEAIGRIFPNTGLGFLFTSIVYLFGLSQLMGRAKRQSRNSVVLANAIVAPTLVWLIMFHVFGITLP